MNRTIWPGALRGRVRQVMTSKSQAHRLLICASRCGEETGLEGLPGSEDADATVRCLRALGTEIRQEGGRLILRRGAAPVGRAELDCGESGSTLRFLLPLAAAEGIPAAFIGRGKLASRPLSPLYERMTEHGVSLSPQGTFPLTLSGRMEPGVFRLAGNVSSQFISGLMMALPSLEGDSRVEIQGRLESRPYVEMTREALRTFGIRTEERDGAFLIPGGQTFRSPGNVRTEADWSGAAFWLCAGALSGEGVICEGMNRDSAQGDREITGLLRRFGADVSWAGDAVTVRKGKLRGIELDAADIPDLVPVVAVTAAWAEGETRISSIGRLRLKESDRVASVLALIRSLGGEAEADEREMRIRGTGGLRGGEAEAFGDHRIAMAAAVAATGAEEPVILHGAETVRKSYPGFFEQFEALGGRLER